VAAILKRSLNSYLTLEVRSFLLRAEPFVRLAFLFCVLACALVATYDFGSRVVVHKLSLSDYTVFWTAARFEHVYNTVEFTRAQVSHIAPNLGQRPFPYPPTALLFIAPLRWLDFDSGVMVWTAIGITAFLFACRLYGRAGLLAIFAPMVALSVLAGQATLLIGAALSAAVALAERRPTLAGILFGLVGAIKPTMAALVPIALITTCNWKALVASVATGTSIFAISLAFGPSLWLEWVKSLPSFLVQVTSHGFRISNVAPGLWFAPLGLLSTIYVFRSSQRPEERLLALVSGTACCTPYMMGYDMAVVAPAGAALMLRRNPFAWVVGSLAFAFAFFHLIPEMALGISLLVAAQSRFTLHLAQRGHLQFNRIIRLKFNRRAETGCP